MSSGIGVSPKAGHLSVPRSKCLHLMHWGNGAAMRSIHKSFTSITFFLDGAPSGAQFRPAGLALKNDLAYVLPGIFQNVLNLAHLVIVKVMVINKDGSGNLC
jgi:hypothetical protein